MCSDDRSSSKFVTGWFVRRSDLICVLWLAVSCKGVVSFAE